MVGIDSHQEFAFHGFYINISGDEHGTIICIRFALIGTLFQHCPTTTHLTVKFAATAIAPGSTLTKRQVMRKKEKRNALCIELICMCKTA